MATYIIGIIEKYRYVFSANRKYTLSDLKLHWIIKFGNHCVDNVCTKGLTGCARMSQEVIVSISAAYANAFTLVKNVWDHPNKC